METNCTYRRHVSTARLGLNSLYSSGQSLEAALSDCKGNLIEYRCRSLADCLRQRFPEFFPNPNISTLVIFHLSMFVQTLRTNLNISAIEFYSNGDIKLHFFPFKYVSSKHLK